MKMNKIYSLASGLLMATALLNTSCRQEESPSVDDFPLNYEITRVDLDGDAQVGALYVQMNWNTNDEGAAKYHRVTGEYDANNKDENGNLNPQIGPNVRPVMGRYGYNFKNSETITLVNQHYEWAAEAGINFFILPEIGYDNNASDGLNESNLSFYNNMEGLGEDMVGTIDMHGVKICATTQPKNFITGTSNTKFLEDDTNDEGVSANMEKLCKYYVGIANRFFNDENYYTVDGKPVVVIWNLQDLHCRDMKAVFDEVRAKMKEASGKDVFFLVRQSQWQPTARFTNFFAKKDAFDAFYMGCMYNQTNWVRTSAYLQMIDQNFIYNSDWAKTNCNMEFVPTISPAFNAWVAGSGTNNYQWPRVDYDVDTFQKFCWVAKKSIGQHKLVIVDSFNDWNWATSVEPTDPFYGNGYGLKMLDMIKSEFKK